MEQSYGKNNNKWFAGNVLKAIRDFNMIEPGETVAVGLSGGVDSAVLLYVLVYINQYSPLKFPLVAFHIKTFSDYPISHLSDYAQSLGVPFISHKIYGQEKGDIPEKGICYTCSRLKKGAIIKMAQEHTIKKIAFGHHANDFAETFFMNIFEHKRIEGLNPANKLDKGDITIIRPMIYLEKETITRMAVHFNIPDLSISCPYEELNKRSDYRKLLNDFSLISNIHKPAKRIVESYYQTEDEHE